MGESMMIFSNLSCWYENNEQWFGVPITVNCPLMQVAGNRWRGSTGISARRQLRQ